MNRVVESLLKTLLPSLEWSVPTNEKEIYLTFDDGPIPGATEFVLDQLEKYNAKATFFCVGDNIGKYPDIYKRILQQGHRTGNHTFNHINGWKVKKSDYLKNIELCKQVMCLQSPYDGTTKMLFRPPYGKITIPEIFKLKDKYRIVMWDNLTKDYDASLSPEDCLQRSLTNTKNGSVVIFHDSIKAEKNMSYALPRFLEYFSSQGYVFKTL